MLVVSLGWQTMRWRDRLEAGRTLREVELRTTAAYVSGRAPVGLLPGHLEALKRVEGFDRAEVGIPIARGTQWLLLRNSRAAIDAYDAALTLEPRPEIYLNLGRAWGMAGNTARASEYFRLAVRLDPNLISDVPPEMRAALGAASATR